MELAEKKTAVFFARTSLRKSQTVVYPEGFENIRPIAKKNHDFELQQEIRKKSRNGGATLDFFDKRLRILSRTRVA